ADEFGRALVPAGLVLVVDAVAEGPARQVEGNRHMGGLLGGDHVDDHPGEAVDGVGGLSAAVAEAVGGQREERPEGHRVSVDEQELLTPVIAGTQGEKTPTSAVAPRHHRAAAYGPLTP